MTTTQQKLDDLHTRLADIYSASPYVTVKNTHTENLWKAIEAEEAKK